jgi:hypothetical protein
MKRHAWIGAILIGLIAGGWAWGGEPCCPMQPLGPAGGWFPYGGGLLRWWDTHCFVCGGTPDDYCRKPIPRLRCPAYPPCYLWGQGVRIVPSGAPNQPGLPGK